MRANSRVRDSPPSVNKICTTTVTKAICNEFIKTISRVRDSPPSLTSLKFVSEMQIIFDSLINVYLTIVSLTNFRRLIALSSLLLIWFSAKFRERFPCPMSPFVTLSVCMKQRFCTRLPGLGGLSVTKTGLNSSLMTYF